ncbi:MAG: DUF4340 domain-containing protein, partial [Halioglobus sp.]|nr:DUF4340 domain-containing protein [Halioglobus sp.]
MRSGTGKSIAVVAALLVIAAVILKSGLMTRQSDDSGLLLPALKSQLNELGTVRLTQAEDAVTIKKSGDGWLVAEKDNYPADAGKLRKTLLDLAEARKLEAKTANPERLAQLGLAADAESTDVTLEGTSADAFTAISLVAGKSAQSKYRYVRMSNDNQAWLIDRNPELSAVPGDWLDDSIMDIGSAGIQSVSIEHADGERLLFSQNDGMLIADNLPEGRELTSPGAASSIASALLNLTLEDVRILPPDAIADTTTTLKSDKGLVVTASHYTLADEDWFSFAASVTDVPGDEAPAKATEESAEAGEADAASGADQAANTGAT